MPSVHGRRRSLSLLSGLLVMAAAGGQMRPALAHYGFPGKYDFARPMYLHGRVLGIEGTLPHMRLTVQVSRSGTRPPRDREWMRPLEDAETRPTLTILAPLDRTGQVQLTLDWRLSRAMLEEPELLRAGDDFEAVVYVRSAQDEYRGELLVVLLRTPDEQVLVSSRPRTPRQQPAASPRQKTGAAAG